MNDFGIFLVVVIGSVLAGSATWFFISLLQKFFNDIFGD